MGIVERKSRQKQALRERILDAARRIVMREGFAALSMRKIADAIEYSPATLYLHFASRDEIAQALCAEGYAQLLETFVPLAQITDPAERLRALGRAYVAFGVAHPETYRLIFMEDPSYTGAALGGMAAMSGTGVSVAANADAGAMDEAVAMPAAGTTAAGTTAAGTTAVGSHPSGKASLAPAKSEDDPGDASLRIMLSALEELKAAGRLSASMDVAVWAEAFWATLHGIVALNLTCPVFPTVPLDTVVGVALDAWLGTQGAGQPPRVTRTSRARKKMPAEAPAESASELSRELAAQPSRPSAPSGKKSTKRPEASALKPATDADTHDPTKSATKPETKAESKPETKAPTRSATRPKATRA
ncbi:TetR/AcrR family transcriptional regulator [Paraburkholderia sp. RL17-337-BIB-A]|uniref:TetR/AcrR family transcriptional regulator n=1 Tax=Paraburkholderia sp. RL17-337-BIB-A TaxID=3031636 RepID=UPI0038BA261F